MENLPTTPDDVTAAWLTAALASNYPGAEVDAVDVVRIQAGTNANARLRLTYAGECELPQAMFLKLPSLDPVRRAALVRSGMGRREALFYQTMAHLVPLRVPRAFISEYVDADDGFLLLLEDLDETGCSLPDPVAGVSVEYAHNAMGDYAAMHVRYEDPARRAEEAAWVTPSNAASEYGRNLLQYGLDNHRDRLTEPFAELSELYIAHQQELQTLWTRGRQTILQGDGHIGNIFIDEAGRPGFLDWGLINLGTPMRDVSYFITMCLSPENRAAHERSLLEHYLDARRDQGGDAIEFDEAWLEHRVQAAYTVPASCQIVEFPDDISPGREAFATAFLGPSEAAIADLESRAAIRESAGL